MLTSNFAERILQDAIVSEKYLNYNDSGKKDMIKSVLNDAKGYVARQFNSLFHLGLLGTLDKLPKTPRNSGVRWMQENGYLPQYENERAEYISNFDLTKDETALLVEVTKIYKSKKAKSNI